MRAAALTEPRAATGWLLALGSNLDENQAAAKLAAAQRLLAVEFVVLESSPTLAGPDIGGDSSRYVNRLLLIEVALPADPLTARLKQIERELGRSAEREAEGWCDVDIDLLARMEGGQLHWLSAKPLQIPAVRRLVIERFGAAALPDETH